MIPVLVRCLADPSLGGALGALGTRLAFPVSEGIEVSVVGSRYRMTVVLIIPSLSLKRKRGNRIILVAQLCISATSPSVIL